VYPVGELAPHCAPAVVKGLLELAVQPALLKPFGPGRWGHIGLEAFLFQEGGKAVVAEAEVRFAVSAVRFPVHVQAIHQSGMRGLQRGIEEPGLVDRLVQRTDEVNAPAGVRRAVAIHRDGSALIAGEGLELVDVRRAQVAYSVFAGQASCVQVEGDAGARYTLVARDAGPALHEDRGAHAGEVHHELFPGDAGLV